MADRTKTTSTTPQSFHEWLQSLIPQIAQGMTCADATIKFVQQLMLVAAGKLKQHSGQQSPNSAIGVGGGQGSMGNAPVGGITRPPGMSMPGNVAGGGAINPMQPSLAAPNLSQGLTPNPDELRRVLAQTAGA